MPLSVPPPILRRPAPADVSEGALPPGDEAARLDALARLYVPDPASASRLDDLARLTSLACGVPVAMISFVDATVERVVAARGVPTGEVPCAESLASHVVARAAPVEVTDLRDDPRLASSRLVTSAPRARAFVGLPLRAPGGQVVGALTALDVVPRRLDAGPREALDCLVRLVESQLALGVLAREGAALGAAQRERHDAIVASIVEREELMAFLVHDVRNQLVVVSANAAYLQEWPAVSEAERRDILDDINTAAGRLQTMLMNVLDLQDATASTMTLHREDFDLGALLTEVARSGRPGEGRPVVRLASAGLTLSADREVLRRVVQNLLDNAHKYGAAPVSLAARALPDDRVEVMVRDHGPGIPASDRERVFRPRVRLEREAVAHAATSRGLGLAFCRAAVEAHGGRIWVDDAAGGGCIFSVVLPRHEASPTPRGAEHSRHPGSADRWRATRDRLTPIVEELQRGRGSSRLSGRG